MPPPLAPVVATPFGKHPNSDATGITQSSSKKKKKGKEPGEGPLQRKRNKDEVDFGSKKLALGSTGEQPLEVGAKRKR
jgi:hypothetical protein